MRAKKSLWPQIEATFKQMDTAATELQCFQVLQKQEQIASSYRINNLWAEVEKQKELERNLQKRYGDLLAELERIQNVMDQYRVQEQQQEEIAAKNHALEVAETACDETDMQETENHKDVPHSVDHGSAMSVNSTNDETAVQQVDLMQEKATSSPRNDKGVDADTEQMTLDTDVKPQVATPAAEEDSATGVPGNWPDSDIADRETTLDTGAAEEQRSVEGSGEDQDAKNPDTMEEAINSHDNEIHETAALD